ncbi:MAG: hypothetical protein ACP5JK_03075, partial [Candidatus Aenigmatarchaeota archaeon]
ITGFVYENMQNFIISDIQQTLPKNIYGKIDEEGLFITYTAFKHLSKYVKLGERSFKKLLLNYGLAEGRSGKLLKDTSFSVAGLKVNGYKINLNLKESINKQTITGNEEAPIDF